MYIDTLAQTPDDFKYRIVVISQSLCCLAGVVQLPKAKTMNDIDPFLI